jgi:hypothetical protein
MRRWSHKTGGFVVSGGLSRFSFKTLDKRPIRRGPKVPAASQLEGWNSLAFEKPLRLSNSLADVD